MLTGIYRYIAIGLAVLLLIAAIVAGVVHIKKINQQNAKTMMNAGADHIQVRQQQETINAVNNAQDVVRRPSAQQLNVVCSKYDRNCPPHHP